MSVVLSVLFIGYAAALFMLLRAWNKIIAKPIPPSSDQHFISLILPVRNEAQTIRLVLQRLISQRYPTDKYEIVVVDDHSTDATVSIVEQFISQTKQVALYLIQSAEHGKKNAITAGIHKSKGEIILTTDADCSMGDEWLAAVNTYFADSHVKMVCGAVKIEGSDTVFSRMQAIELASLVGSGAAALHLELPLMCNGANLAYRKATFSEVGGYEGNFHIPSGDDEFLLRKIAGRYPHGVVFNADKKSVVSTQAQKTWGEFMQQRIRWAGKWQEGTDWRTKSIALMVICFHIAVLVLIMMMITGYVNWVTGVVLLILKACSEFFFLNGVTSWLTLRWNWFAFILLQASYSFYAVWIGVLSNFMKPVWKGRISGNNLITNNFQSTTKNQTY